MADLECGLCGVLAVLVTAALAPGDDSPNWPYPGVAPAGRFTPDVAPPDGVRSRSGRFPAAP